MHGLSSLRESTSNKTCTARKTIFFFTSNIWYGPMRKMYCIMIVMLHCIKINLLCQKCCLILGTTMQSVLHFKFLFVVVCLTNQAIMITADNQDKLGLVTNIGNFKIATGIEKSYLSVTVLANSTLETFTTYINRINNSIGAPAKIAGLKANQELKEQYYEIFFPGATALWDIAVDLEIISSYKDPTKSSQPSYSCHAVFNIPSELHFLEVANTMEFAAKTISLAWTAEDLKKSPAQELLMDFIHDAKLDVLNLAELVRTQLLILDELTTGKLPGNLMTFLQQQLTCWPFGTFENAYLLDCEKVSIGLQCDIALEAYKTISEYERLLPINYNGVELYLGNHSVLVKQSDDSLLLLSCPTLNENFVNICDKKEYDNKCADNLLTDDYSNAVDNCNFSLKVPPPPFLTSKKGVLIMDKKYEIQLFKANLKIKTIENKSPLLLFTNNMVHLIANGITQTFHGNNNDIEKVLYSLLNKTLINRMKTKALKKAISEWDMNSILQYMALTVHFAVFPIAFVSCCVSVRALKAFKPLKRSIKLLKRSGKTKQNSPVIKRANYMHNKRYAKRNSS